MYWRPGKDDIWPIREVPASSVRRLPEDCVWCGRLGIIYFYMLITHSEDPVAPNAIRRY